MAIIERDFGLKSDAQGFLLGVKKLGQDVAQIDTNVEKILDILGNYAPVKDFKQALHQSQLSSDTAKIAANSDNLLQSHRQLVTLLNSSTQSQSSSQNAGKTQSPKPSVDLNHPNRPPQGAGNPDPFPLINLDHPNRPPQNAGQANNQPPPEPNEQPQNAGDVPPINNNERQRDENGRFVGSGETEKKGFLSKIVQAIKSGFSGDSSSIDPSIDAMREVGQVLEPVGKVAEFTLRPFGFRSKEKNKPLSREEERHNRRQIRLLERIARMSRGGSNGGLGSGLAGGLLGGLLRGAGGLLLRAVMSPIALLAGAFFGGYKLGEIIAPKISEWTDSLIKADIPKRISNAWDTFTGGLSDYFKEKINNIKENTKEVVNDAKDTVGSVGDFAAYQTDRLLAKLGNKEAIERLAQRDRGEIGFTPQNYKAKTTNNTSLGQVAADTGQALTTQPSGHKYAPLLDEIAKGESLSGAFGTSGYDAVYGGAKVKPSKPVSQMTIGEVKEYQKQLIKAGSGSSAVGRYQFIKNDDAFAKMTAQAGLKDTDIFDDTAQDRLAVHYMGGEKKVDELLKTGNDAALANVVARQWASMQNASGRGNYDGDRIGNFARHGGISAMQKARQQILANEAQPKPTNTVLTKAPTPIVNGLTTTPLAMLPKAQAPAFSLMRPTQQVEVKPSAISQPQHKIAAPQIPKPESVKEPIGTPSPMMVRNVDNGQQITQNLSDRHLAHLVTGGLGMTDRWIR